MAAHKLPKSSTCHTHIHTHSFFVCSQKANPLKRRLFLIIIITIWRGRRRKTGQQANWAYHYNKTILKRNENGNGKMKKKKGIVNVLTMVPLRTTRRGRGLLAFIFLYVRNSIIFFKAFIYFSRGGSLECGRHFWFSSSDHLLLRLLLLLVTPWREKGNGKEKEEKTNPFILLKPSPL